MFNKIIKRTLIYLTVAIVTVGMNTVTFAATQNDYDGDIIENPWADLFKDDNKDPGDLEPDDKNNQKDNDSKNNSTDNTKSNVTEDTVKKTLKTTVVSATKKTKSAKKAKVVVKKITVLKNVKYQIKYGTNKKIKKFRIKTFKKNKITLIKLKANKKYYVKARAYVVANNKKTIYGEWTKIKAIKIKKK